MRVFGVFLFLMPSLSLGSILSDKSMVELYQVEVKKNQETHNYSPVVTIEPWRVFSGAVADYNFSLSVCNTTFHSDIRYGFEKQCQIDMEYLSARMPSQSMTYYLPDSSENRKGSFDSVKHPVNPQNGLRSADEPQRSPLGQNETGSYILMVYDKFYYNLTTNNFTITNKTYFFSENQIYKLQYNNSIVSKSLLENTQFMSESFYCSNFIHNENFVACLCSEPSSNSLKIVAISFDVENGNFYFENSELERYVSSVGSFVLTPTLQKDQLLVVGDSESFLATVIQTPGQSEPRITISLHQSLFNLPSKFQNIQVLSQTVVNLEEQSGALDFLVLLYQNVSGSEYFLALFGLETSGANQEIITLNLTQLAEQDSQRNTDLPEKADFTSLKFDRVFNSSSFSVIITTESFLNYIAHFESPDDSNTKENWSIKGFERFYPYQLTQDDQAAQCSVTSYQSQCFSSPSFAFFTFEVNCHLPNQSNQIFFAVYHRNSSWVDSSAPVYHFLAHNLTNIEDLSVLNISPFQNLTLQMEVPNSQMLNGNGSSEIITPNATWDFVFLYSNTSNGGLVMDFYQLHGSIQVILGRGPFLFSDYFQINALASCGTFSEGFSKIKLHLIKNYPFQYLFIWYIVFLIGTGFLLVAFYLMVSLLKKIKRRPKQCKKRPKSSNLSKLDIRSHGNSDL